MEELVINELFEHIIDFNHVGEVVIIPANSVGPVRVFFYIPVLLNTKPPLSFTIGRFP